MNKRLWTAYEAAAATGGMLCARGGNPDCWEAEEWTAEGIAIDSRSLKPGEMFVALSDTRDGHHFIDNAFAAGASAALVSKPPDNAAAGRPFLVVRDTLEGLRDLARAARLRNFGKRIAVTGSAGKTSTKDMLRTMLAAAGEVHATDRSFNNHFGVPLTLARLPMTSKYSVFEIGMNHAGEITPLVDLVRPHTALITTVAAAHLEFFDSVEAIAEAKAEIFTGIKPGGTAILPRDNPHYALLRKRAEASPASVIWSFGQHKDSDMRLIDIHPTAQGQKITAYFQGKEFHYELGAHGEHQALNSLAALAAVISIQVSGDNVLSGLAAFKASMGRGGRIQLSLPGNRGIVTLIDESYNANPASMAAALSLLGTLEPGSSTGRRIAVLGEMLELGQNSKALHAGLEEHLSRARVDSLYGTGELMESLWAVVPDKMKGALDPDPNLLAEKISSALQDGDIIMVKGSNASKVSTVVDHLMAFNTTRNKT